MSQQTQVVELETWMNPGQGRVVIRRFDHRGELVNEEMVGPERSFAISTFEREQNQRLAASPNQDMFRNGTLAPVHLIEGSDAAREMAANPNLLTDGEMHSLVGPAKGKSKAKAGEDFVARLADITNATTLHRLLQLAEADDAPISRVRAIQARLSQVEGVGLQTGDSVVDGPGAGGPAGRAGAARAVTPR